MKCGLEGVRDLTPSIYNHFSGENDDAGGASIVFPY